MKLRRYEVKDLKTGKVHIFTGGEKERQKANALENELVTFESESEIVCPTCGRAVIDSIFLKRRVTPNK